MYVVNLCHISPWAATTGLFAAAARLLESGGHLCIYGPFKVEGAFTSDGNRDFDQSLQSRDAAWGIRDVSELQEAGKPLGITLENTHEMPANNLLLHFRKA
ncbi:hypothetical protein T484DRAFT_1641386 [Baffinella frigidus]|nr:hypothetical protein T484DRAFT_1641386 [Cryptophyta sp. CCMP2293]